MGNCCSPPELRSAVTSKTKLLILVIGGPCSGKSTQSRILSNHFHLQYISPDQIIRECLNQETLRKPQARLERLHRRRLRTYNTLLIHNKMSKEAKEFLGKDTMTVSTSHHHFSLHRPSDSEDDLLDCPPLIRDIQKSLKRGDPVPPHIITIIVYNVMRQLVRNCNGFVIDGYPRDATQAKQFSQMIGDPHVIVYLECSDKIMIDRVLERANRTQRYDDNEPFTRMKINSFHKNFVELSNLWTDKYIPILNVNGNESSAAVGKECIELVQQKIARQFKIRKFRNWEKMTIEEHAAGDADDSKREKQLGGT